MEGIFYVTDEQNVRRYVQIDLELYGHLWEDFFDLIVAHSRQDEETISLDQVKEELQKYGKI